MPYKADGTWQPENDDVQTAVTGVIDAGGPLMKRARGIGQGIANARGLANSSMNVSLASNAVLDKAVTIGGQQSSQTHAKNIQKQTDVEAGQRLNAQLAAEAAMQQSAIAAEMAKLQTQIAATAKLADAGDKAAMDRLQLQLQSQSALQQQSSEAALKLQNAADTAAGGRQQQQSATQLTLAEIEAATSKANTAVNATTNMNAAYLGALASGMNNEKIPADVRAQFNQTIQQVTQQSLGLVSQVTGQSMSWGSMSSGGSGLTDDQGRSVTRQNDGTYLRADGSTYAGQDTVTGRYRFENGQWIAE